MKENKTFEPPQPSAKQILYLLAGYAITEFLFQDEAGIFPGLRAAIDLLGPTLADPIHNQSSDFVSAALYKYALGNPIINEAIKRTRKPPRRPKLQNFLENNFSVLGSCVTFAAFTGYEYWQSLIHHAPITKPDIVACAAGITLICHAPHIARSAIHLFKDNKSTAEKNTSSQSPPKNTL